MSSTSLQKSLDKTTKLSHVRPFFLISTGYSLQQIKDSSNRNVRNTLYLYTTKNTGEGGWRVGTGALFC